MELTLNEHSADINVITKKGKTTKHWENHYAYDGKGNQTAYGYVCQGNDIVSCKYKQYYTYDDKGNKTGEGCNPQGKECSTTYTITYDEE